MKNKFKTKFYYPLYRFWNNKVKDPIRYLIRPCHSELRKTIPRSYCDLDELIVELNFAIVRSLVEKEYGGVDELYSKYLAVPQKGDEYNKELVDSWNHFRQQLFNCYKYIVDKRPKMLKDIENAVPSEGKHIRMKTYWLLDNGEARLKEMDTLWLRWVINNRGYFWT